MKEAEEANIQPDLEVPEFRPTKGEFEDFKGYVSKLLKICKPVGLCKVSY